MTNPYGNYNNKLAGESSFHGFVLGEWQCELAPGFIIRPMKGRVPNAFHRLMQQLLLGFKWTKVN